MALLGLVVNVVFIWLMVFWVNVERCIVVSKHVTEFVSHEAANVIGIGAFTPPPTGRTAERTRKGRWQQAAQHEIKAMLYNEWAEIGTLPVVYHRSQ